ncbi:MAG: rod shape-determining protein MreD [Gammaproteobacteria bacterium]|nr:rod shape-determining protein MreD [Gammaproteobacteria bacterium]
MSARQRLWPIILYLIAAMILSVLPMPDWAAPFRPDWVGLTLIFWSMHLPRRFGLGAAWLSGLALDALKGALLGQHALALTIVAFFTLKFRLRLRVFPIWQQSVTVLALIAVYEFILYWVDGMAGRSVDGTDRWIPVVTSAVIWPLVALFFGRLQRRLAFE